MTPGQRIPQSASAQSEGKYGDLLLDNFGGEWSGWVRRLRKTTFLMHESVPKAVVTLHEIKRLWKQRRTSKISAASLVFQKVKEQKQKSGADVRRSNRMLIRTLFFALPALAIATSGYAQVPATRSLRLLRQTRHRSDRVGSWYQLKASLRQKLRLEYRASHQARRPR